MRALLDALLYRAMVYRCRYCGAPHPTLLGHIYGLEGRTRTRRH